MWGTAWPSIDSREKPNTNRRMRTNSDVTTCKFKKWWFPNKTDDDALKTGSTSSKSPSWGFGFDHLQRNKVAENLENDASIFGKDAAAVETGDQAVDEGRHFFRKAYVTFHQALGHQLWRVSKGSKKFAVAVAFLWIPGWGRPEIRATDRCFLSQY